MGLVLGCIDAEFLNYKSTQSSFATKVVDHLWTAARAGLPLDLKRAAAEALEHPVTLEQWLELDQADALTELELKRVVARVVAQSTERGRPSGPVGEIYSRTKLFKLVRELSVPFSFA